eukprot:1686492-Pleurochrysis_carterae.AAC.1
MDRRRSMVEGDWQEGRSNDFTGVALADPVPTPAELEAIAIDPVHTVAGGGTPAAPGTRAHVHAQIAVQGLAALGLHAAPTKV